MPEIRGDYLKAEEPLHRFFGILEDVKHFTSQFQTLTPHIARLPEVGILSWYISNDIEAVLQRLQTVNITLEVSLSLLSPLVMYSC